MKDLILSLKQQGKTVLLCSHLLADVQDVCDRITILFAGKMQTLGQVRDLLQVKDITQFQTRGMTDEPDRRSASSSSDGWASNDADVTHPTTTLEDLFMRVVRENSGNRRIHAKPVASQAASLRRRVAGAESCGVLDPPCFKRRRPSIRAPVLRLDRAGVSPRSPALVRRLR